MSNKLSKILSILMYVFLGVSAVMGVLFYMDVITEEPMIIWAYALTGAAALFAVVFPIIFLIGNPKKAKNSLIGIVFIGIVVLIGYAISSDAVLDITGYTGQDNVPSRLKMVGTGLFSMYLLGGIAIFAVAFTEIYRLFK